MKWLLKPFKVDIISLVILKKIPLRRTLDGVKMTGGAHATLVAQIDPRRIKQRIVWLIFYLPFTYFNYPSNFHLC